MIEQGLQLHVGIPRFIYSSSHRLHDRCVGSRLPRSTISRRTWWWRLEVLMVYHSWDIYIYVMYCMYVTFGPSRSTTDSVIKSKRCLESKQTYLIRVELKPRYPTTCSHSEFASVSTCTMETDSTPSISQYYEKREAELQQQIQHLEARVAPLKHTHTWSIKQMWWYCVVITVHMAQTTLGSFLIWVSMT